MGTDNDGAKSVNINMGLVECLASLVGAKWTGYIFY